MHFKYPLYYRKAYGMSRLSQLPSTGDYQLRESDKPHRIMSSNAKAKKTRLLMLECTSSSNISVNKKVIRVTVSSVCMTQSVSDPETLSSYELRMNDVVVSTWA